MQDDDTVAGTLAGAAGSATAAIPDRYTLGALLGRGGMGEVVSARDEKIGRSVAIKRMHAEATPDAIARFEREAKIQGCLDHPAIVPVHELASDASGAPFFVMKQLAGITLADVLDKLAAGDAATAKAFTRQRLLRAFAEVCLAVELAHTRGIVHRDLKPANIVLGDFGEVFVLDWGIAKIVGDRQGAPRDIITLDDGDTVAGAILGTPGYMAPEQIEGAADLDGGADVYALGCILFEILALAPLHPRGRDGLASALAGKSVAPSSRSKSDDVPPELDKICLRATASERADRHASARELGDAVQHFLDGDRDVALRRVLAATALADARTHLENDPSDRNGDAMRDVGRAVALDPANEEAPQLLTKLMVEALPTRPPPEVEAELEEADLENQLATRRLTATAGWGYLASIPVILWVGFSPWLTVLVALAGIAMVFVGRFVTASNVTAMSRFAVGIHMFTIIIATRLASPFVLAPAMGVVVAMSNSTLTRFARPLTMAALFIAAVIGPFALEKLGLIGSTVAVSGNRLELTFAVDRLEPTATVIALSMFVAGVIMFGSLLAGRFVHQRRVALQQTKVHAWRLRQLIARPR